MFGRATIRLGIGPHSSYDVYYSFYRGGDMSSKATYSDLRPQSRIKFVYMYSLSLYISLMMTQLCTVYRPTVCMHD